MIADQELSSIFERASQVRELHVILGTRPQMRRYDPENDPRDLLLIASKGFSLKAAAGILAVSLPTLRTWGEKYPDFAMALERFDAMLSATHEAACMTGLPAPEMGYRIRLLQNVNPEAFSSGAVPSAGANLPSEINITFVAPGAIKQAGGGENQALEKLN